MAQTSWPFENIDTTESQFSIMFRNFQNTGVNGVPGDNNLLVFADDSGLQVRIRAGQAIVRGHYYLSDALETVILDTAGNNTRKDAIVLELDPAANNITIHVIKGAEAISNPEPPELIQTDVGIYQMLLAYVTVSNGATSIQAGDVQDLRQFMGNLLGIWTDNTRPVNPVANFTFGYNTTEAKHEYWNGTSWVAFGESVWTTAERPTSPSLGQTGYNTTLSQYEVYNGTAWERIGPSKFDTSPFLLIGA